jgi:hypothetical protein
MFLVAPICTATVIRCEAARTPDRRPRRHQRWLCGERRTGLIAIGFLASIGYVWWCALTGRRGPWLRPAIAALVGEGALVVVNRGDCPLGPLGDRMGDPVPLFELVLSPRAARRAVPSLGVLTAVGLGFWRHESVRSAAALMCGITAPPKRALSRRPSHTRQAAARDTALAIVKVRRGGRRPRQDPQRESQRRPAMVNGASMRRSSHGRSQKRTTILDYD